VPHAVVPFESSVQGEMASDIEQSSRRRIRSASTSIRGWDGASDPAAGGHSQLEAPSSLPGD
jgi:hypothetical protein